ncbi:MAG: biopolymer transporter ExbD [Deltaproteobacteria bacterium]|nr:biopolymer transporter ExbD [Deltaproteobacteria bacterium]
MESIRYSRRRRTSVRDLNITPLIDMVFILLIFFVVTTSFVKEAGVAVERPIAQTAETKDKVSLMIGLDAEGVIYIQGRSVDIRSVRARVEQYLAETPEGSVVIVADKASQTGVVIRLLDACRLAGAKDLSIAARKPD